MNGERYKHDWNQAHSKLDEYSGRVYTENGANKIRHSILNDLDGNVTSEQISRNWMYIMRCETQSVQEKRIVKAQCAEFENSTQLFF